MEKLTIETKDKYVEFCLDDGIAVSLKVEIDKVDNMPTENEWVFVFYQILLILKTKNVYTTQVWF